MPKRPDCRCAVSVKSLPTKTNRPAQVVLVVMALSLGLAACGNLHRTALPATTTSASSHPVTRAEQSTSPITNLPAPTTTTSELPPLPPSSTTTTANPEIAMLQSEISDEESVLTRDTATLQGDEGTLSSDTQWCNEPLDGGFTGTVRDIPCSTAVENDDNAVSQDTQELSYAQATLETEEQELSAAGQ